jgi:phosphoserine phosphatase RsbU/P
MEEILLSGIKNQLYERKKRINKSLSVLPRTDKLLNLLKEVDKALERIDQGVYGICEECHDPIEPERLMADPLLTVCLDHLSKDQQRALEIDLEDAGKIQRSLLPKSDIILDGWEFTYCYYPAGVVSGDFCDLIPDTDGSMIFIIGDVSGKGVAASLMMTHLHALLHSLISFNLPIDEIMQKTNRLFCESAISSNYATMIAGKALHDGTLEICNAGHNPPYILSGEEIIPVPATGIPVGLYGDIEYETRRFSLNKGDSIFLYTDGLTESSLNDEEYGPERLVNHLRTLYGASSTDMLDHVLESQRSFLKNNRASDDITVAVIRKLK